MPYLALLTVFKLTYGVSSIRLLNSKLKLSSAGIYICLFESKRIILSEEDLEAFDIVSLDNGTFI